MVVDEERAPRAPGPVLLTGATGFVGGHAYPALVAAGLEVRCAARDPARARARWPERDWVALDLDRPETLGPALAGCRAALYLVHGMSDPGATDYPAREAAGADAFARAAAAAGLERVVYLGGVAPRGAPSRHLASRLATGARLREGPVPALELRAGMVIGQGSASWLMVRDLAARLPAMLLPRWLGNRSWPLAIDDVVAGLLLALLRLPPTSAWFDLPGPERVTHREVLVRVAALLGRRPPMLSVPVLSPRLSSYWIAGVTRVPLAMAQELVEGVTSDLDPTGRVLWDEAPGHVLTPLDLAFRRALGDEGLLEAPSREAWERLTALGRALGRPERAAV